MTDCDRCPDWWHQLLTAPPQTITREDLERFFDRCTCAVTHDTATNTTTIDPTGCTYSGHFDPPLEMFDG